MLSNLIKIETHYMKIKIIEVIRMNIDENISCYYMSWLGIGQNKINSVSWVCSKTVVVIITVLILQKVLKFTSI